MAGPRYGIFGGTFDPPHIAHLILAEEAHVQLHLNRVLWIVTPEPPHKRGHPLTPWPLRVRLVQAAVADNPAFEVSLLEGERPGPHFAVETMRILRERYPEAVLVYLMGGDSLAGLPSWHRPAEFVALCDEIGVLRRPYDSVDLQRLEVQIPGLQDKVRFLDTPLLDVSATDIRRRVAQGLPYRYFVHPGVAHLIQALGLYRQAPVALAKTPAGGPGWISTP